MPRIEGSIHIHNVIPDLRRSEGITQQELADAVGVTRATILALEKGNYNPSLELAFRLSSFFNIGIEKIFSERKIKQ